MVDLDRGSQGRTPRLRSLTAESQQDFISGFRQWMATEMDGEIRGHAEALLRRHGVNDADPALPVLKQLFDDDPLIATRVRLWISNQRQMWLGLREQFESNRGFYLAELDRAEACADGRLRLDPDLIIPDYCRHEIHIQPGGYVGDDLAGPLYHYGTNSFYMGQNDSDQFHAGLARRAQPPADGRVTAVVDLGCGIGQLAMALKEVFPGAAVTGIDVAAPMLRYGHQRASALGLEVDFVQALAQSTPLPSGSVDLITAYLLFHEVPQSVGRDICAEAFRLLRPGGVFDVSDFPSGSLRQASPAYAKYRSWLDHHYNGERWSQEFVNSDFIATLESVGFSAELRSSKIAWVVPNYVARKPDV